MKTLNKAKTFIKYLVLIKSSQLKNFKIIFPLNIKKLNYIIIINYPNSKLSIKKIKILKFIFFNL
jgi:hypothetical protein